MSTTLYSFVTAWCTVNDIELEMTAYSRPARPDLPALTPSALGQYLDLTQDLVLLLDDDDVVSYVYQDHTLFNEDSFMWVGRTFESILSVESRAKVRLILDNDVQDASSDARWRHINLNRLNAPSLPVLARYTRIVGDAVQARLIFCRDLRPLEEANQRFLDAERRWELSRQDLLRQLRGA